MANLEWSEKHVLKLCPTIVTAQGCSYSGIDDTLVQWRTVRWGWYRDREPLHKRPSHVPQHRQSLAVTIRVPEIVPSQNIAEHLICSLQRCSCEPALPCKGNVHELCHITEIRSSNKPLMADLGLKERSNKEEPFLFIAFPKASYTSRHSIPCPNQDDCLCALSWQQSLAIRPLCCPSWLHSPLASFQECTATGILSIFQAKQ